MTNPIYRNNERTEMQINETLELDGYTLTNENRNFNCLEGLELDEYELCVIIDKLNSSRFDDGEVSIEYRKNGHTYQVIQDERDSNYFSFKKVM